MQTNSLLFSFTHYLRCKHFSADGFQGFPVQPYFILLFAYGFRLCVYVCVEERIYFYKRLDERNIWMDKHARDSFVCSFSKQFFFLLYYVRDEYTLTPRGLVMFFFSFPLFYFCALPVHVWNYVFCHWSDGALWHHMSNKRKTQKFSRV